MPSPYMTEWLLSLFTTRDAAGLIAGDLTEEARQRGRLWFWFHTLRTAARLC